jgi:hypothetical protein
MSSNWSLDFAPMLPLPIYWAAVAVAAILITLLLVRRSRGVLLRALALAAVIFALANPTLRQEERENLGNIAIVIVDESTSQTLSTRPAQAAAIRKNLEAKLGRIENLEVKWITSSRPSDTARAGTNVFADLNRALADTPPDRLAGVIVITDGQIHDIPKQAKDLGFTAPVHALLTGQPREFDRRIELIKAPRYGIVGQSREIELKILETGDKRQSGNESLTLKIRREGEPNEERRVSVGERLKIPMKFPHSGQNIVELELSAVKGELTAANNRVVVVAEGVRENLRVLLVSGKPHAGERTWRNLLKSDAAVDLVHFTILRPPQKQDGTPINELSLIAFPTRELFSQKIKEFDLIVFDRYEHRGILQLLYYDNIARYVERHGGALLVGAGEAYAGQRSIVRTPLFPVLPAMPTGDIIEQPFRPRLTDDGVRHPVTRDLPGGDIKTPNWGRWYRQIDVIRERGRTVMQGVRDKPLLVLDRKGKGRVALLTSDQAWLWARKFDGGGPHTQLLRRLAHWLMKEPDLEEERLRATARGLNITIERRSMEDEVSGITVSEPGGKSSNLALTKSGPGRWQATMKASQAGLYKFQTESPNGKLTAVANAGIADPREMSQVTATDAKLRPIIEKTGGGVYWTKTRSLLASSNPADVIVPRVTMLTAARVLSGSSWMGLRDREAYITRGVKLTPMFTGMLALAALLFLITLAWWREGR